MTSAGNLKDCRPQYWFDEIKHPAFRIASFGLPAYILPLTVCAVFLGFKAYMIYTVDSGRPIEYDNGVLSPMKEKVVAPDAENQRETIQVQRSPPFHRTLLKQILRFHNQAWISMGLFDTANRYGLSLTPSCLLHVATLLLAGAVLDRQNLRSCLFAAVGWLAYLLQQYHAYGSLIASMGTIALALPCAWMLGEEGDKYWSSYNGIFLVVLASDPHISTDSALRSPKLVKKEVWPWGFLVAFGLVKGTVELGRRACSQSDNMAQRIRAFVEEAVVVQMPELVHTLSRIAAFLLSIAAFFCVTGLCCASLGWRWILLGLPATPPTGILAAYLGGMLFLTVWCIRSAVQGGDRRKRSNKGLILALNEVKFCAETAGWTATGITCFWLVLVALPRASSRGGLVCF